MSLAPEIVAELGLERVAEDVYVREVTTTNRAIDLYLGEVSRRLRPRTRATYSRILEEFLDTLPVDEDVAKVTDIQVGRFLDRYLKKSRGTQAQVFTVLKCFFDFTARTEKIKRSPMANMLPPRRLPPEALDVVTLSSDDVRKLLASARGWTEKLSVALPAYMGCRRRAAAQLRVKNYDARNRMIRFQEKGGKTIWKPVPDELAEMLDARLAQPPPPPRPGEVRTPRNSSGSGTRSVHGASAVPDPDDYLIPSESPHRNGERDDRVIWKAVKRAGDRCGVDVHVHALRAAFAVFYLEQNAGDLEALQPLMGHRSIATTQVYLRRLNRESAMERVRGLSWA